MSSFMHTDNKKKDILILKGPTQGLHNTTLSVGKEYSVIFTEQQNKFCLSLHYNRMNSYLFDNGVERYKFTAKD